MTGDEETGKPESKENGLEMNDNPTIPVEIKEEKKTLDTPEILKGTSL